MGDNFVKIELNNIVWDIPERYENISVLGAGAYGHVCSADVVSRYGVNLSVAIKKLSRPFQSAIDAKRTYRELRILNHMNHSNIIALLDVFTPATTLEMFNDVFVVTPLMVADLRNIVKTRTLEQKTKLETNELIKFLVYQILRGMKYVHSAGIVHRDLKPSNIVVNEDWELKLLDFGLARHTDNEMTGYVATRWYRAPEIMLCIEPLHYHQSVDMWSVGCIIAEMLTGKELFPGNDHIDQLNRILDLCGTPTEESICKITSGEARNYMRSLPKMERKNFKEVFKGSDPLIIDLLDKMLEIDVDRRITAVQALAHPYITVSVYSDPEDEPNSSPFEQTFEGLDLSVEEWKVHVWREVQNFKRAQQMIQSNKDKCCNMHNCCK